MNKSEFLTVIYSGVKPGLIIQTKNSRSQIIGIDTKGNIQYLLRNAYKKKISEAEWTAVYNELSKGKITSSQIREIVGTSRTCNAGVIKWFLTKFGLAILDTKNVWIATWKLDSNLIFNNNVKLALVDRHGEIVSVNQAWSNFALENGGGYELSNGVGLNYLEVCKSSFGQHSEDAARAYAGIQSVIDGSKNLYTQHYSCHSLHQHRWNIMFAWQFAEKYTRISHVDVEFEV